MVNWEELPKNIRSVLALKNTAVTTVNTMVFCVIFHTL